VAGKRPTTGRQATPRVESCAKRKDWVRLDYDNVMNITCSNPHKKKKSVFFFLKIRKSVWRLAFHIG